MCGYTWNFKLYSGQDRDESMPLTTIFAIVELFMFNHNENFLCVFENSYIIIDDSYLDVTNFCVET